MSHRSQETQIADLVGRLSEIGRGHWMPVRCPDGPTRRSMIDGPLSRLAKRSSVAEVEGQDLAEALRGHPDAEILHVVAPDDGTVRSWWAKANSAWTLIRKHPGSIVVWLKPEHYPTAADEAPDLVRRALVGVELLTTTEPIRWLHFSDLHMGSRAHPLWWTAQKDLEHSVKDLVSKFGSPDLILFTGDLTNRGTREEFDLFDKFLDTLLQWLTVDPSHSPPLIVPVPGNHDLNRPQGSAVREYRILDDYARDDDQDVADLKTELWEHRRFAFLEELFSEYTEWLERRIVKELDAAEGVEYHLSRFPGDLRVSLGRPKRPPLTVVGLNSAWRQWRHGDYEGRLEISPVQFHLALTDAQDRSPLDILPEGGHALLLLHHPPVWLSKRSQRDFLESIYTPDRFLACLHGHMHEGRSQALALSGGLPRHYFQAPSLFGLEYYGEQESRSFGYVFGELDAAGAVRVRPLIRVNRGGGEGAFVHDQTFPGDLATGVVINPGHNPRTDAESARSTHRTKHRPSDHARAELDAAIATYRQRALARYGSLSLIGVGGGDFRLAFDQVYVPLSISHRPESGDFERHGKRRAEAAYELASGDISLEDIFRKERGHPHAVIFGYPGAGKTTCLRKLLHLALTRSGEQALQDLAPDTLPILLRLRSLTPELLDLPFGSYLDQEIAALAVSEGAHEISPLPPDFGARLWERGRLLLLLDGLDEIPTDELRVRACTYLERHLEEAKDQNIRAVVSCRYTGYAGHVHLGDAFLTLDIRPLGPSQVTDLVQAWFHAAAQALEHYSPEEAKAQASALLQGLESREYSAQQIKVLTGSPLLLTLLCVVVLRGGEIPRRRVIFYDQCLRVMLGQWGKAQGRPVPPVDLERALAILRLVAWHLQSAHRRDDLTSAEFVDLYEERLGIAKDTPSAFDVLRWLDDHTGVLENTGGGRYGFVHLGIQEYLTATHVAAEPEKALDTLLLEIDDRWWREVALLLVGLGDGSASERFLGALLRSNDFLETKLGLVADCLREAEGPFLEPFVKLLGDDRAAPERKAAVLRLLRGRSSPELLEVVQSLAGHPHADLAGLVQRMVDESQASDPTAPTPYDAFLAYHPSRGAEAMALADRLRERGLRPWIDSKVLGPETSWLEHLETILRECPKALVHVASFDAPPWADPGIAACLRTFHRRDRVVIPVIGVATGSEIQLPATLHEDPVLLVPDLDLGLAKLERLLLGDPTTRAPDAHAEAPNTRPTAGTLFVEPVTGMRFLWVPGGEFLMGGEGISGDELPIHRVRQSAFWLAETPVTNRQYAAFLRETGHIEPAYWRDPRFSDQDQPVVGVGWDDAAAFCSWISNPLGLGAALPSEAQWEFAARGTDGRRFPWGNTEPDARRAHFDQDRSSGKPAPVGSFPDGRGPYGHLDLAGNVWEWCRDLWVPRAYEGRQNRVTNDPETKGDGSVRSARGGSWDGPAHNLRAAYRSWFGARHAFDGLGFRVAVSPASP